MSYQATKFRVNWTTKSGRVKHCVVTGLSKTLETFTKRKRAGNRRVSWQNAGTANEKDQL